jgi:hypothetical protein
MTRKGIRRGQTYDWSACCHNDYTHCENCGRNGAYYFGDEILNNVRSSHYSSLTRAGVLEAVLEWIEQHPTSIMSGKHHFVRFDMPNRLYCDSRQPQALKWLVHVGILERVEELSNRTRNVYRVRNTNESRSGK